MSYTVNILHGMSYHIETVVVPKKFLWSNSFMICIGDSALLYVVCSYIHSEKEQVTRTYRMSEGVISNVWGGHNADRSRTEGRNEVLPNVR